MKMIYLICVTLVVTFTACQNERKRANAVISNAGMPELYPLYSLTGQWRIWEGDKNSIDQIWVSREAGVVTLVTNITTTDNRGVHEIWVPGSHTYEANPAPGPGKGAEYTAILASTPATKQSTITAVIEVRELKIEWGDQVMPLRQERVLSTVTNEVHFTDSR